MTQSRSTKRVAAVYLVLAGLQRLVGFLILPVISHAMSPAEYGAASILTNTTILLLALLAPVELLVFRATARDDHDGPALIRVVAIYCYVILPVVVGAASAAVALFLPELFGIDGGIWGIELLAVGFLPAATSFALPALRARHALRRFAFLAVASVLMIAISKLVFIVVLHLGVLGWAISDLVSAVLSALLAIAVVRPPRVGVNSTHIRAAANFCAPLIPHRTSFWALTSLSRPALAAVSSLTQVGILSIGLSLASVSYTILAEINQAVQPQYARETLPPPTDETRGAVRWQLVLAFVVPAVAGAGLALAGPWVLAKPYWPALALTGILICGQVFVGLYVILMNYLVLTAGHSRLGAIASVPGAIVILVGILVLGGPLGARGAAFITTLGFFVMAVVALALTRGLKLGIHWNSWIACAPEIAVAAGSLMCAVAALSLQVRTASAISFAAASLVTAAASLAITFRRTNAGR